MSELFSYVKSGKNTIKGWFSRVDSQICYELLSHQNATNISGGVAEIGLHHGKSFVALCLGLVGDQKAYGIDVFEDQSLNIDKSGCGARDIVVANLDSFGVMSSAYILDARSSETVRPKDITAKAGRIRFFSIDGGHWREIVQSDLQLAEQVLADGGVIALDDFYRPEWPDVSLGFFDWFENSTKNIVPLAIGFNKLYLCEKQRVADFKNILQSSRFLRHFLSKTYNFLGEEIPIFQSYPLPEWRLHTRIKEYLKIYNPDFYVRVFG